MGDINLIDEGNTNNFGTEDNNGENESVPIIFHFKPTKSHCIFCSAECPPIFAIDHGKIIQVEMDVELVEEPVFTSHGILERQLNPMNILRNILDIRNETFVRLLGEFDGQFNPEFWLNVCVSCKVIVEQFNNARKQIAAWESEAENLKRGLKCLIFESNRNADPDEEFDPFKMWKEIRNEALIGFMEPPINDENQEIFQNEVEQVDIKIDPDSIMTVEAGPTIRVKVEGEGKTIKEKRGTRPQTSVRKAANVATPKLVKSRLTKKKRPSLKPLSSNGSHATTVTKGRIIKDRTKAEGNKEESGRLKNKPLVQGENEQQLHNDPVSVSSSASTPTALKITSEILASTPGVMLIPDDEIMSSMSEIGEPIPVGLNTIQHVQVGNFFNHPERNESVAAVSIMENQVNQPKLEQNIKPLSSNGSNATTVTKAKIIKDGTKAKDNNKNQKKQSGRLKNKPMVQGKNEQQLLNDPVSVSSSASTPTAIKIRLEILTSTPGVMVITNNEIMSSSEIGEPIPVDLNTIQHIQVWDFFNPLERNESVATVAMENTVNQAKPKVEKNDTVINPQVDDPSLTVIGNIPQVPPPHPIIHESSQVWNVTKKKSVENDSPSNSIDSGNAASIPNSDGAILDSEDEEEETLYICRLCHETLRQPQLDEHRRMHYPPPALPPLDSRRPGLRNGPPVAPAIPLVRTHGFTKMRGPLRKSIYKCQRCPAKVKRIEIESHRLLHYKGGRGTLCEHCGVAILKKSRIQHLSLECVKCPGSRKQARKARVNEHYKCKACLALIKPDEQELRRHLELHTNRTSKRIVCHVCGWLVDNICDHNEEWHSSERSKRNEWARRPNFWVVDDSYPSYLLMRQQYISKYKCKRCPAEFFNSLEAVEHLYLHTEGEGEGVHCLSCNWLVDPWKLREHEDKHHFPRESNDDGTLTSRLAWKYKDYWNCGQCEGRFLKESKEEHEQLHRSGNGATCTVCGLMIKSQSMMRTHLTYFHPELGNTGKHYN